MSEKSLWLFIFILLYAAYCFFWGVRGSKNNSENPENYYLANRNISSWVFFFAATAATSPPPPPPSSLVTMTAGVSVTEIVKAASAVLL